MSWIARGLLGGVVTLHLLATAVVAQSGARFGFAGGVSIPSGPTGDALKTGWHGMALARFLPPSSQIGVQLDGAYHRMPFEAGGGKAEVFDGTLDLVYQLSSSPDSRVRSYLIGGGGVYHINENPDAGSSASSTKFGVNAGAGFEMGWASTSLFIEGRFHSVFVTGSDFRFIPVAIGLRFGG